MWGLSFSNHVLTGLLIWTSCYLTGTEFSYHCPRAKPVSQNKDVHPHSLFEIDTNWKQKNRCAADGEKKIDWLSLQRKAKHLRKQNINMLCVVLRRLEGENLIRYRHPLLWLLSVLLMQSERHKRKIHLWHVSGRCFPLSSSPNEKMVRDATVTLTTSEELSFIS